MNNVSCRRSGAVLLSLYCLASYAAAQAPESALSATVEHFQAEGLSFAAALKELTLSGDGKFVIGFELVKSQALTPKVTLVLDNATVSQILTSLCAQDRRYTFSGAGHGVIDVRLDYEPAALRDAMDIEIPSIKLNAPQWQQLSLVVERLRQRKPQLFGCQWP